jgi:hypothetical protein
MNISLNASPIPGACQEAVTTARILAIVMSQRIANNRVDRGLQGGNTLVESGCAMSEVQICGIPKLCGWEVASTA